MGILGYDVLEGLVKPKLPNLTQWANRPCSLSGALPVRAGIGSHQVKDTLQASF